MDYQEWKSFSGSEWKERIDVRDFIQSNYRQYNWDESFLAEPTNRTTGLLAKCRALLAKESEKGGVLDIDTKTVSTITSHAPGYIDKENELVFGLQTDAPLRRAIKPFGGIRTVKAYDAEDYEWGRFSRQNEEVFQMAETLFSEEELEQLYFRFQDCDRNLGTVKKEELKEMAEKLRKKFPVQI